MTNDPDLRERLRFLARVVERQCDHLEVTDRRVFANGFTAGDAQRLKDDVDLAERVEAFVSRFGRLQDTVADKLLPAYLRAAGESPGLAVDNLDRAERLGFIDSVNEWFALRKLRNQMVHEYIEDPKILASALSHGHDAVPKLVAAGRRLIADMRQRRWLDG